jgi:type II secretion system protein G
MKKILFKRGFTLIELLVVIAIIGILTAIVTANFTTAKSRSRDAKRISDLANIQLALEQVFDRCNKYPSLSDYSGFTNTVCSNGTTSFSLSYFISVIPKDPNGSSYTYNVNSTGTDYVLKAGLENKMPALDDDAEGNPINTSPGYCDDGTTQPFSYCVQPK